MATTFSLKNGTHKENTIAYITLGATPGCVQDVSKLSLNNGAVKIIEIAPLMGYFILNAGETVNIKAPEGDGFNGNISFNTPPLNCRTKHFQMGVNLAEFIINNGFQAGNPQETIDNSCVCGANACIKFVVSADDWTTNGGAIAVKEFENGLWRENTGRVGVFPYGCDNCTSSDNPPACVGRQPQYANTEPICNVQRNAKSNNGGNVEIIFLGTYAIL